MDPFRDRLLSVSGWGETGGCESSPRAQRSHSYIEEPLPVDHRLRSGLPCGKANAVPRGRTVPWTACILVAVQNPPPAPPLTDKDAQPLAGTTSTGGVAFTGGGEATGSITG